MGTWRSTNVTCDCCSKTLQTSGRTVSDARTAATRAGWTQDKNGRKDWCPDCSGFQCRGRH